MRRPEQGIALLTLLATVGAATQCACHAIKARGVSSQNGSAVTVAAQSPPGPRIRGKAEGSAEPFEFKGRDLRAAVISHPAPDVWLSFPSTDDEGAAPTAEGAASGVRVDLPPEAKRLLRSQWEVSLASEYDWEFVEPSNVEARRLLSVRVAQSSQESALRLTKMFIEAPSGRRRISLDEANDLARFVGRKVA